MTPTVEQVGGSGRMSVAVDLAHGGRWTSLRGGAVEWLWSRDAPERSGVVPGAPFVDAGGMEECIPTVRGQPDHGDVWSRPWTGDGRCATVTTAELSLTRTISPGAAGIIVDYALAAAPGYRFVWAAHLLLELSDAATLDCEAGAAVRVFEHGEDWSHATWPDAGGFHLDRLGPADGTAISAIVETPEVTVTDGNRRLSLAVRAEDQPLGIGIWRNLRGWPAGAPYRSIGVEPMVGRVWDVSTGGAGDTGVTGADGRAGWRLSLETAGA